MIRRRLPGCLMTRVSAFFYYIVRKKSPMIYHSSLLIRKRINCKMNVLLMSEQRDERHDIVDHFFRSLLCPGIYPLLKDIVDKPPFRSSLVFLPEGPLRKLTLPLTDLIGHAGEDDRHVFGHDFLHITFHSGEMVEVSEKEFPPGSFVRS